MGLLQSWGGLVDGVLPGRCGDCVLSECARMGGTQDRIAARDVIKNYHYQGRGSPVDTL